MTFLSRSCIGQETDLAFQASIDEWVLDAADVKEASFGVLLSRLPGVFPSEALASVRRLGKKSVLPRKYCKEIETNARMRVNTPDVAHRITADHRLVDHPLDFEWPFSLGSHEAIRDVLRNTCAAQKSTVLCLGCPSFVAYTQRTRSPYGIVLWDKNASRIGQMGEINMLSDLDLINDVVPSVVAHAAVLDPPWYNSFCRLFIWAAAASVQVGGAMLLSFPSVGTRPSAAADLREILSWCRQIGVELQSHHPGRLPYRTPLFEWNALRAQGLYNVPLDWRRGDLLVLRKRLHVLTPRPAIPPAVGSWSEHRIGVVRIKIRFGDREYAPAPLRCVGRTSVLPSVSTRYPGRERANVVTSGNRFFHTRSPASFRELCQRSSIRWKSSGRTAIRVHHADLCEQLTQLVLQETRETTEYLKATYDLR